MSPRKPAVLRDAGGDQTLREHMIASAARLVAERGTAGLTVRDMAAAAGLAGGVLYNHFADKEELIALALRAHVDAVLNAPAGLPEPGTGTLADNLKAHIEYGLATLNRILPAFAGVFGQPKVFARFHELGGHGTLGGSGLPVSFAAYIRAEQELGRVRPDVDPAATASLVVGACHDVTLPRLFHGTPAEEITIPPGFVDGLVNTILHGIAPPQSA
ncbi:MAG: TetR/AcrR family transcriptional regulator [Streptomycetaceae bacterium]|nr:TetR/AcrR family transcriptional regulator [Streptomycetaceae bacterium]